VFAGADLLALARALGTRFSTPAGPALTAAGLTNANDNQPARPSRRVPACHTNLPDDVLVGPDRPWLHRVNDRIKGGGRQALEQQVARDGALCGAGRRGAGARRRGRRQAADSRGSRGAIAMCAGNEEDGWPQRYPGAGYWLADHPPAGQAQRQPYMHASTCHPSMCHPCRPPSAAHR
jgi:hypothetical protein